MDLINELKKMPPEHVGHGVSLFVQEHFDQIKKALKMGYSWKQITQVVMAKSSIPSANLNKSLQAAYFATKKKMYREKNSCIQRDS
ncbi:MAG: hypothetical protein II964_00745 [Synergistaceae bacterium]|nr:hypothetical protein [Synergistaceae bacterium]